MAAKETVSARVPADTLERFEEYREQRDLSKSDAGRRLIERGLSGSGESSPFQFWTRLNEALTAAVMSLTVAAVAGAALAALLDAPWVANWGESALQAATIGLVALVGTVIQQARVRRREESISYVDQIRELAATTTSSNQQEATNS